MSSEIGWGAAAPAARDTGNVLDGTALGALLGGSGAAAGFSIDYERVPQAIADLEHAAEFFKKRAEVAHELARVPAPGIDGVSLNAVAQIGRWASDTGTRFRSRSAADTIGWSVQHGVLRVDQHHA